MGHQTAKFILHEAAMLIVHILQK